MAQTATIYNLSIDLSDVDRGVYEQLDVRIARHPSETAEYMLVRVLAYCLEFQDGIFLTEGVASADEPAILIRDMTGQITAWIEVGLPRRLPASSGKQDGQPSGCLYAPWTTAPVTTGRVEGPQI